MQPNKYVYLFVIQGNWGFGWEDEDADESALAAYANLRLYRENQPDVSHRMIQRRELRAP